MTKQGVRVFEQLTKINTLAISNTNKQTFTSHDEKHLTKFELLNIMNFAREILSYKDLSKFQQKNKSRSVSYTHLTLPTKA